MGRVEDPGLPFRPPPPLVTLSRGLGLTLHCTVVSLGLLTLGEGIRLTGNSRQDI